MDTAHDFSYVILRLLTIPCCFSLSMLSWIFARLRESKDINSCHLKRQVKQRRKGASPAEVSQKNPISAAGVVI